jgi:hypothetical protein
MRYFSILAALTLTACALPGVPGTGSFMTAMHPTQEFCASRGMTLDATTKQCVTPPHPAPPSPSPPADVTGSVPKVAQAQPPPQPAPSTPLAPLAPLASSAPPAVPERPLPQEHARASPAAPIEPDAVIHAELSQDFDLMSELTHFVRASGYRCDSISALAPLPAARGYKLVCNRSSYKYAIEHKDGRSIVTVD